MTLPRLALTLAILSAPAPLWAEVLPALHAVTGVAGGDVLNIRAAPSASAEKIGALDPAATGIEVVARQGGWAQINSAEGAGWVSARFLTPVPAMAEWTSLALPLSCFGTEPFWSIALPGAGPVARFSSPEGDRDLTIAKRWPGDGLVTEAAFDSDLGFATLRQGACNDGMSDRAFAISVTLFPHEEGEAILHGCCSLLP